MTEREKNTVRFLSLTENRTSPQSHNTGGTNIDNNTMMDTMPSQSTLPATRALEMLQGNMPAREYRRTAIVSPDSSGSSLSSMGEGESRQAFDMNDLLRATRPVEDSVAFPVIEWCRDDSDEGDTDGIPVSRKNKAQHDDEEETCLGKRRRSGPQLGRSKSLKMDLSSLVSSSSLGPATLALETKLQFGSWGQFVSDDDAPTFSIGSNKSPTYPRTQRQRSSKSPVSRCQQRERLQLFSQEPKAFELTEMSRRIVL